MYIFNPEHDLCIANGDAHFVPPDSALEFGRDCAELSKWMNGLDYMPQHKYNSEKIIPWGWNKVLYTRLIKSGVNKSSLLSESQLDIIRNLSHRKVAIEAMNFVLSGVKSVNNEIIYSIPIETNDLAEIRKLVNINKKVVLKAPWSGSGKGLRWVGESPSNNNLIFSDSDEGWCKNIIAKQGSVIVERRYNVVQDFAMLFKCTSNGVEFVGYSLFYTNNGMYKGNLLASNSAIYKILTNFVSSDILNEIRDRLMKFIQIKFVGSYIGYIGVDQFICECNGDYKLNPVVEINVRMTMGLIARNIYDNYIDKLVDLSGTDNNIDGKYCLNVEFRPQKGELKRYFDSNPQIFALCPVVCESRFGIAILRNI